MKIAGKRVSALNIFLFIVFVISSQVLAGDSRVFTNEDVETYEKLHHSDDESLKKSKKGKKHREDSGQQSNKREYWCKRGTAVQEKVERAREKVAKAEEYCAEMRSKKFWRKASDRSVENADLKLEKAKEQLRSAERSYRAIDDEAHRKGIPPGWLRCQF